MHIITTPTGRLTYGNLFHESKTFARSNRYEYVSPLASVDYSFLENYFMAQIVNTGAALADIYQQCARWMTRFPSVTQSQPLKQFKRDLEERTYAWRKRASTALSAFALTNSMDCGSFTAKLPPGLLPCILWRTSEICMPPWIMSGIWPYGETSALKTWV